VSNDRHAQRRGRPIGDWLDFHQKKAPGTPAIPCACVNALHVGVMPRALPVGLWRTIVVIIWMPQVVLRQLT
jgi:hypothetical protein